MAAPVRYLSYAIDTVLLTAALMLLTILPGAMFANGWLTAEAGAGRGATSCSALRAQARAHAAHAADLLRRRTAGVRDDLGIARAHHPLGWLLRWLG